MKIKKKSQKQLREEFTQASRMKEYAENQVRFQAGTSGEKESKEYLARVEKLLAEIGGQIK